MASTQSTIRVRFDGSVAGLQRAAAAAQKSLAGVGSTASSLLRPLAGLAAGGGAIQGLLGVAAAAAQLSGAALLLPAGLLAGAAAFSVFKLATSGISDAIGAVSTGAKSAGSSTSAMAGAIRAAEKQVVDAKKGVVDAQKDVIDSLKDEERAQKDLRDAQQDLNEAREDAIRQLDELRERTSDYALDQEGAAISLAEAQQELQEVMADSEATELDRRKALYGVATAQERVSDLAREAKQSQQELAEAERKGVEGSDQVVDAKERVTDASDRVVEAQERTKEAQDGVVEAQQRVQEAMQNLADVQRQAAEAASAASGGVDALAEALAKLSPNARDFVLTVRDLKDEFATMQKAVQDRFFEGFAQTTRDLAATYLPKLQTGLGNVAGAMNGVILEGAKALLAPANVASVDRSLVGTTGLFANMRGALANVVTGFLTLGGIGSDYLPRLGTAIDNVALKFRSWVDAKGENGIKLLIDNAIAGFKDLWAIAQNVGSILGSIFTGLGGENTTFLTSLRETTTALAEFFRSAEAQTALQALGETMRVAGSAAKDVLLAGLQALNPIIVALSPVVQSIATQLASILVPAIQAFAGWVQGLIPTLTQNKDLIAGLVIGAAGLAIGLQGLMGVINGVIAVQKAWKAATLAFTIVQTALNVVMSANPITLVVLAIAALVAGLIIAWNTSETFRNVVTGAWEAVKGAIGAAVDWIKGAIQWFADLPTMISDWFGQAKDWAIKKWEELVEWVKGFPQKISDGISSLATNLKTWFTQWWEGAKQSTIQKATDLINWVRDIPNKIKTALGNIGGLLLQSGRALVDGFLNGIKGAWSTLTGWVRSGMQTLRNLWPFSPAKEGPFSGRGYVTYSGRAITADFASALKAGQPGVIAAARGLMDAAHAPLSAQGVGVTTAGWETSLTGPLRAPSAAAGAGAVTEVRVFLGDRELTDIVRTEIATTNRATRQRATAGAGRGW